MNGNDNTQATVFNADDMSVIEEARLAQEAEDADNAATETPAPAPVAAPVAAPAPVAETPVAAPPAAPAAPAPAPVSAPAPTAPAAAPAQPAEHHLHAALRVTRREAERLAAENEALRLAAKTAAPAPKPKPTAEELAEVEEFSPTVVAHMRQLEEENQRLAAKAAAATAPPPAEFTPMSFKPATQAAIDKVPALFAMQYDPDQTAFEIAVREDAILRKMPAWQGKSDEECFAEAARLANARLGRTTAAAPPAPLTDAERALAAVAAATAAAPAPVAIGDLRGGNSPTSELPDFSKMSDADIFASLPVS